MSSKDVKTRMLREEDAQRNVFFHSDEYKIGRVLGLFPKFLSVGKQESDIVYKYQEHVQDEYEFIYILKGAVEYKCNGESFVAKADDMYFIQPGQRHEDRRSKAPRRGIRPPSAGKRRPTGSAPFPSQGRAECQ